LTEGPVIAYHQQKITADAAVSVSIPRQDIDIVFVFATMPTHSGSFTTPFSQKKPFLWKLRIFFM